MKYKPKNATLTLTDVKESISYILPYKIKPENYCFCHLLTTQIRLHVIAIFQDSGKVYASTKQQKLTKARQTNYLHS